MVWATALAWSEWAAEPPAIMRTKLRAATTSGVAPHMPRFSGSPSFLGGVSLQGPIAQFLQQIPLAPMVHSLRLSALLNAVECSPASFLSTSMVASHMLFSSKSANCPQLLVLLELEGLDGPNPSSCLLPSEPSLSLRGAS